MIGHGPVVEMLIIIAEGVSWQRRQWKLQAATGAQTVLEGALARIRSHG